MRCFQQISNILLHISLRCYARAKLDGLGCTDLQFLHCQSAEASSMLSTHKPWGTERGKLGISPESNKTKSFSKASFFIIAESFFQYNSNLHTIPTRWFRLIFTGTWSVFLLLQLRNHKEKNERSFRQRSCSHIRWSFPAYLSRCKQRSGISGSFVSPFNLKTQWHSAKRRNVEEYKNILFTYFHRCNTSYASSTVIRSVYWWPFLFRRSLQTKNTWVSPLLQSLLMVVGSILQACFPRLVTPQTTYSTIVCTYCAGCWWNRFFVWLEGKQVISSSNWHNFWSFFACLGA